MKLKQITWDEGGGFRKFLENKNMTTSQSGNSSSSIKSKIYLKKISEVIQGKKNNRLSVIKEDETEEERRASTIRLKIVHNKLINKLKNVNLFNRNLNDVQLNKLSLKINEYEIQPDTDIFSKG